MMINDLHLINMEIVKQSITTIQNQKEVVLCNHSRTFVGQTSWR